MNSVGAKQASHEAFWRGQGPSPILIAPAQQDLYDLNDYPARFCDPQAMWESEMGRAEPLVAWPTDGIPTVRPNLGVNRAECAAMQGLWHEWTLT